MTPAMTPPAVTDERLRNIRAWNAARVDSLSGAAATVEICDELLSRRAADAQSSDAWVPWKPGDAMPERGRYPVLRNDADGDNLPYPALAYCTGKEWEPIDSHWPVIAYLPRPLPPPPSVDSACASRAAADNEVTP